MTQGQRLSQDQIDAVAESLSVNPNWNAAADFAGVSDRVLRLYRERVEGLESIAARPGVVIADLSADDRFYQEAVQAWRSARSRGEKELVDSIRTAMAKDWRAAESLLKKGWPDRYNDRVELTGAGGGPIQVSSEELMARAEEAHARALAKVGAASTNVEEPTTDGDEDAEPASPGNVE